MARWRSRRWVPRSSSVVEMATTISKRDWEEDAQQQQSVGGDGDAEGEGEEEVVYQAFKDIEAVSYTHQTLPTNREV